MAKYKVEIEGQGNFIIEVPDGAPAPTEADVMMALSAQRQERVAATPPPSGKDIGALDTILGPGLQGLTFGLADEAAAGIGAFKDALQGKGFGKYPEYRDALRQQLKQTESDHPVASFSSTVVGSLPTLAIPALNMSRGAKLADTVRSAAKAGGIAGALSGAGAADGGAPERLAGAAKGAALGATVAGSIPVVGRGVGRVTQTVADALADTPFGRALSSLPSVVPVGPERGAQKVAEALQRDAMTLDDAAARVAELRATGKPAVLADAGSENIRGLADAAMLSPNTARAGVAEQLVNRAENAGARVIDDLVATTGMKGDAQAVSKALIKERADDAAPLYAYAYSKGAQGIQDDRIIDLLRRPAFKQALDHAYVMARNDGVALPPLWDRNGKQITNPTLELLDWIKRGVDKVVYSGKRQGTMDPHEAAIIKRARNEFVNLIDSHVPEYAPARAAFSGPTRMVEAVEDGRRFATMTPSDITDMLKTEYTTQAEREHFLLGAVDHLKAAIQSAPDGADVYKRVFGNQTRRAQLESLFPSKDAFRDFAQRMQAEKTMRTTNDAIRGNSRTAARLANQADMADQEMLTTIPQVLSGNWMGPAGQALKSRAHGNVGKNAEAMLPILFGDPVAGLAAVRRAAEAMQRKAATPVRSAAPAGTVSGLLMGRPR